MLIKNVKFSIIISLAIIFIYSCNNTNEQEQNKVIIDTTTYTGPAKISFTETTIDLETLTAGEIVECSFTFKNIGAETLKISEIKADCGCTVPKLKTKVIKSGETQKIVVTFDSNGFSGNVFKKISVISNSIENNTELYIVALINNPNIINNY